MKRRILNFFIIAVYFLFSPTLVLSQEDTTVSDLQNKINEYSQKLDELSKAKDTLANQIKILDSQVSLTILKINQTENSIKILESEIDNLTVKINDLDVFLNHLSSVYIEQISQNYKLKKRSPAFVSLLTGNFNRYLEQQKYLAVMQKSSHDTLMNMETARTSYDIQKTQKTKKQAELEALQKQLADQKISLAKQKESKSNLLTVTKNDETKYQQLRAAAESELSSLLKAKFVGKRTVKKGEALGLMGNTGYSFGDHLHYGLYNLKEDQINSWSYTNDIDSSEYTSKYGLPMENPEITQGRGVTKYSYLYSDKFHHGVDMVSSNKTIMAVNEGVAYFFRNPGSSLGNHVKLFHPDGKMTLYLHMQ